MAASRATRKGINVCTPLACAASPTANGIKAAPIDPTIKLYPKTAYQTPR
jgi:hypothetical protein